MRNHPGEINNFNSTSVEISNLIAIAAEKWQVFILYVQENNPTFL